MGLSHPRWLCGGKAPLLACSARTIAQMKLWLFIYTPPLRSRLRSFAFQRHCVPSRPYPSPISCILTRSSLSLWLLPLSLRSRLPSLYIRGRRCVLRLLRDVMPLVQSTVSVPCKLSRELTPARLLCARHMMRDVNRTIMCLSHVQSARFVLM